MAARLGRGAVVVAMAAAMLLGSGCSRQVGSPVPDGVPPPAGDPVPRIDPRIGVQAAGRPADQLRAWAEQRAPALDIPVPALEAYAYAARAAEVQNPGCHLAWTTLAGIGMVESRHGNFRGAAIAPNGDVSPPIRGVELDGTRGNRAILDDVDPGDGPGEGQGDGPGGGNPVYARAMGPMQFIPETWRLYGVDANNDGTASPDNLDDAALAAAGYLCSRGGDLGTARGWTRALWAYNQSNVYARSVRDWATAYAAGHHL
ncbi:MAG: lytic murein transglycosylase [Mycobacterium sp.]